MQLKDDKKYYLTGDIDPLELCKKYDSPLYVYDASIIERQFNRIINAFDVKKLKVNYACKALTNLSILKLMRKLGANLDCVSIQEVQIAFPIVWVLKKSRKPLPWVFILILIISLS
jgi:diaminopimelate decarboxylase